MNHSTSSNEDTCVQRVWDNGDMTDCGSSPTVGATLLCMSCLRKAIENAKVSMENAEAEAMNAKANYKRLCAALEPRVGDK